MTIQEEWGRRLLIFDGAMGTMLQEAGLEAGELPELWNLTHPQEVLAIHRQYLEAGCDILKTNTFGANALKLAQGPNDVATVVARGVELARRAVTQAGRQAYVAMDIGPSGKLLRPLGDLDFERAVSLFGEMAAAGEAAGADAVLIETISDTYEAKAAVLGAKEHTRLPVYVTLMLDERGKLLTGGDIGAAVALLEGLGVNAIGFNCGLGPVQMAALLPTLLACTSLPVIVNPNAGLPQCLDGRTVYDVAPAAFADELRHMAENGAWALGGCCGTTPAHIAALRQAVQSLPPVPIAPKRRTVVSSYSHAVTLGEGPVIIGERINPTGKKRFQQALRDRDIDYILREGLTQQENGAHILDVNVGLPDIDEPALLEAVTCELQGVCALPLQLDTSDPAAMARAMRVYNGKPMINSVNGKRASMEAVFPLVKRYGGVVVALTLDEEGIPDTAAGRLRIARRIVETAADYGIAKENIVVDVLTMAVSAGQEAARITLEALQLVKQELDVCTVLGVSNVSFGLPRREVVNAAFFTMALQTGLDAAILNPTIPAMTDAYHAYRALQGYDAHCEAYIARMTGTDAPPPAAAAGLSLAQAIARGLKEQAYTAACERLKTAAPLDLISRELVPALDEVGQGFEKGTLFLPQLLMSAEAAKAAFEAVRAQIEASGRPPVKGERIILATVKGDIHDIGKNIVKVLLDNYGFDVIDLGRDVDPQVIADTALEQEVRLVGLSALMTTTVSSMEQTIRLLREVKPDCRVMVGGAVLTQAYADQIGADFYSKDAMASVHYAQRFFGQG